jgi:4a-hydroxytetrahydrobiopterin dehydratase
MEELAKRHCVPCHGGTPRLTGGNLTWIASQLGGGWQLEGETKLRKSFRFPDFATALAFVNQVGAIAEAEGHHPDVLLAWGKVQIELWTHAIDGLSEADFILAAKIDTIPLPAAPSPG